MGCRLYIVAGETAPLCRDRLTVATQRQHKQPDSRGCESCDHERTLMANKRVSYTTVFSIYFHVLAANCGCQRDRRDAGEEGGVVLASLLFISMNQSVRRPPSLGHQHDLDWMTKAHRVDEHCGSRESPWRVGARLDLGPTRVRGVFENRDITTNQQPTISLKRLALL